MKKSLLVVFAILLSLSPLPAETIRPEIPSGYSKQRIGTIKLADPSGAFHSRSEIAGKVVVIIFSIPSMSQGDRQETWAGLLADNPKTKVSDAVGLVLIEDMSQAGMFKGIARDRMKKEFKPDSRPFLILDETGISRKRWGVPENKTQIMIYDKQGLLRDIETNLDLQDATLHRIQAITHQLLAE